MDTEALLARLEALETSIEGVFVHAKDEHALREARARLLGGDGPVAEAMKVLATASREHKPRLGKRINALKQSVQRVFESSLVRIEEEAMLASLHVPMLDVTLPGHRRGRGGLHPLSETRFAMLEIMRRLGFEAVDGPEVDRYDYNFDMLGFPPDHPATDMQDSFFLHPPDRAGAESEASPHAYRHLLRTHTSTVQVREMLRRQPPLALVSSGAVYRRDSDVTHSPMFFQMEGLLVDRHVRLSDLKGTLNALLRALFGDALPIRWRPSYFPFVEPGVEVDIGFRRPGDKDWRWMEVLGAGMVHPVVFEHVGYDPERLQGFAFGIGIDRVTMLRHGIEDIRLLYANDPRFLSQFSCRSERAQGRENQGAARA